MSIALRNRKCLTSLSYFNKLYYFILNKSELSQNSFIRIMGCFLRVFTPYFPIKFFFYSWRIRGHRSLISWFSFVIQAFVRQFVAYVYPARRCKKEKELLNSFRKNYDSLNGYSHDILVSVIIPTYNRSELLTTQAIPSILNQSHRNIELIVVGDHCTDDTENLIQKFEDPRVKFINLPKQGNYPKIEIWRWLVAGAEPANVGLHLAKGNWITNLDDDIVFTKNHIENMLKFALKSDCELVHGLLGEQIGKTWRYQGRPGQITNCTTLYRNYMKIFNNDLDCWKKNEAADFNRWKRMFLAGVKISFYGPNCEVYMLEKQQSRYIK